MICPFIFVVSGLIVALIMNTAAAGATVRLRFSPKYHRLTLFPVPINFLNIPEGSLGGHIVVVGTGYSKFVSFCLASPRSVNVITVASDGSGVYEHNHQLPIHNIFSVQSYFWKEWLLSRIKKKRDENRKVLFAVHRCPSQHWCYLYVRSTIPMPPILHPLSTLCVPHSL
jgi:hypothetical protein